MVGVWVLVLLITTALTWQIVSLASDQVADAPVAIAPATSTTLDSSTTSTHTSSTTIPTTTTPSATKGGASPTTSTPAGGGTSPSATQPTSSTSSAGVWSLRTVTTQGGTVVIRHRPGEVELQAATPAPGFEMEIDDAGPPEVRVEFERGETHVRVEAKWEDTGLDLKVSGDE